MKNKFKKIITVFAITFLGLTGIIATTPTFAATNGTTPNCTNICDNNCPVDDAVKRANGCDSNNSTDELPNVITGIINGIIAALGIVAVVFIVIGGVQYMTSTGDPSKTKKAKDTILYAAIGLIICVLSFAIVNFVVKNIINGERNASHYTSSQACNNAGFSWNSSNNRCE